MTWIATQNQEIPNTKHSKKLIEFICDCKFQTKKKMAWKNFATNKSQSCGKCHFVSTSDIIKEKFNKLKIITNLPKNTPISKNTKLEFKCDCGNTKNIALKSVLNNLTKSCGCLLNGKSTKFKNYAINYLGTKKTPTSSKVRTKIESWWTSQKFGKLKVISGQGPIAIASDKLLECICNCGILCKIRAGHLTSSRTKSCGKCSETATQWWATQNITTYPNNLEEFKKTLSGSFLEPVVYSRKKSKLYCKLCGSIFTTRFHDIFLKKIKSCGCMKTKISKPVLEISAFLKSHGVENIIENQLGNWYVDLFCPQFNLAIDFHGLYYHCNKFNDRSKTEYKKYKSLIIDYDYIIIFEDEWKTKQELFKSLLLNKCKKLTPKSIRPQNCHLDIITSQEVNEFYEQYHYLGGRNSKYNFGMFYENKLVSAMSFNPPSRQSVYDLELTRMAANPHFKIHGMWSYYFKHIDIKGKIVSFSDDRLFLGKIYETLGFKLDAMIQPDYYYTNGHIRNHKSLMRKTKEERKISMTEKDLRRNQGWYQIWDVGKKRWIINMI
jgi:hypothetical protein